MYSHERELFAGMLAEGANPELTKFFDELFNSKRRIPDKIYSAEELIQLYKQKYLGPVPNTKSPFYPVAYKLCESKLNALIVTLQNGLKYYFQVDSYGKVIAHREASIYELYSLRDFLS